MKEALASHEVELGKKNRLMANRIRGILLRHNKNPDKPYANIVGFRDPNDRIASKSISLTTIVVEKEGDEVDELYFNVPPGLSRPAYCLQIDLSPKARPEAKATSQYGILPAAIIGPNDRFYRVDNFYIFDSNGRSVKIERIDSLQDESEDLNSYLKDFEYSDEEKSRLKKVNFIPTEGQRIVPLSAEDYRQISDLLDKIDMEEYKIEGKL